jgi:DNA replication protein DnaC
MTTCEKTKCRECGELFGTIVIAEVLESRITQQFCEACQAKLDAKVEADREIEAQRERRDTIMRGVPVIYRDARVKDFALADEVSNWIESPEGFLFIWGSCGTGKSHLACATAMRLRSRGLTTGIEFSSDLFLRLRASFNGTGKESEIIDNMSSGIVMIFDDVGAQKISDYTIEAWYTIIDRRYRNGYPTMFTSNLSLKEVSAYMSDRVASRLASGIQYELKGPDRRFVKRGNP